MPIDMLRQYIGKTVSIMVAGEIAAGEYTLLEVEENWVKAENKKQIVILNGDMISGIYIKK